MDLVPLVSNADNKIILLMSNVNNNRSSNNRSSSCSYLELLVGV
jgi:hypothetical protein